ncbi:XRE/MutR family transcriptional regulator [Streptococcus orisasini]|uniref:XRE/MutR family transcriptional regulator n=1 Tax=Streptococcus orisasini TaxID=1080071 RepID=UPI0007104B19|nr:XRE/MutR family transcriptional regulator [Streptococcus orisasini]
MLGKSLKLGELYKELRMARGLKLKDVARDNLSVSQLSKFENGQNMLAADKLLLAISGIHMTFSEFGHALNNYKESDFFKIGNKIVELQSKRDIESLKKILDTYGDYENFDTYNRLNRLVVRVAIHTLDPSYIISDEDKEFLTTYLYNIEEWTEYELNLFGNTMIILSIEDLIFLGKAFIERNKLYISIPTNKKNAQIALLNLIMILIESKELYHANYFINYLEKLLTYQDMFIIVSLNFLKQMIAYLQGEITDKSELEHYIDMVEKLGNPTMAMFLRANMEQLLRNFDSNK